MHKEILKKDTNLRLTPSRLEKRLRQTLRLALVLLESSQISCIFCNKGDGSPVRTNAWMSVYYLVAPSGTTVYCYQVNTSNHV